MKNWLHINQFQFKGNEDINNKLLSRIGEKEKGEKRVFGRNICERLKKSCLYPTQIKNYIEFLSRV